jgi:uncharacterized protein
MLTEAEIQTLADKIAKRMEPEKIIIFGSYAKGTATARSDLDLLVIKDTPLPMHARDADVCTLTTHRLINVDVHKPEELEEYWNERFSFRC